MFAAEAAKHMKHGIATLSIIPVRKEGDHRSELVNQLLFGESYVIIEKHKDWLFIESTYDGYRGWIDLKQHHTLSDRDFANIKESEVGIAVDLVSSAASSQHSVPVVAGSTLPFFD